MDIEIDKIKGACENLGISYEDFFNDEEKIEELQKITSPVIFKKENSLIDFLVNSLSILSKKIDNLQKTLDKSEIGEGTKIEELTKSVNNFINSPINSGSQQPQKAKSIRSVPYIEKGVNPFNSNQQEIVDVSIKDRGLKGKIGKKMELEISKGISGFYTKVAMQLDAGYLDNECRQELLQKENINIVN